MDKAYWHSSAAGQGVWRDSVDSDFDALADQLQRCQSAHESWAGRAERLRSFAAPRVATMCVLGLIMLFALHLLFG